MFPKPVPRVTLEVYACEADIFLPAAKRNIYFASFPSDPVTFVPHEVHALSGALDRIRSIVEASPLEDGTDASDTMLWKSGQQVILRAAKVRNFTALGRAYALYSVSWAMDRICMLPSHAVRSGYNFYSQPGGYDGPPCLTIEIAKLIIDDYRARFSRT